VASGLTPYRALRAGTINVARFFGTADHTGTVAVGKEASLVLVDANPPENVANMRKISGVMVRGGGTRLLSTSRCWQPRTADAGGVSVRVDPWEINGHVADEHGARSDDGDTHPEHETEWAPSGGQLGLAFEPRRQAHTREAAVCASTLN
jgi:hypothetical protein